MTGFRTWMFLILLVAPGLSHAGMQAGVASMVITPTMPMFLSGYAARTRASHGVDHDLHCKALALGDAEGNQAVILTSDVLGVTREMSEWVKARLTRRIGIPPQSILITASHTHYAPVIQDVLEPNAILPSEHVAQSRFYTDWLKQRMVDTAILALDSMAPSFLAYENGHAGFAVNRREYTLDGVRIGVNPIGPVDHSVPVLRVMDDRYRVKAILFGYACHNTTQPHSRYRINGDWAGIAQQELENQYPGSIALFMTGCGGDINPDPRGSYDLAVQHGRELAQSVQTVLHSPMNAADGVLRTAFSQIDLPYESTPSRDGLEAQLAVIHPFGQARALRLLRILEQQNEIPSTHPYPIHALRIGDGFTLIALGGEVVVDYSLRLKHKYGEQTWVAAYTHDAIGYIPSLRVLREGGYESDTSTLYYGLPGPWDESVETMILREIHAIMNSGRKP